MDHAQDLREMLHMAALLKGAAARAAFRDCFGIFLGVSELLERRAVMLAAGETESGETASQPPARQPINIMT